MSSITEVLPLEIIILIIDQVVNSTDDESFTDLKACSSTCTTLLPLCRKHKFHSVTLDLRPGENTLLSSFTKLVESSPRVIEYIRELKLSPINHHYGLSSAEESTLGKLRMIHTLTLEPGSIIGVDWKALKPSTRSTLLRLIQLPTIVNLSLSVFLHFTLFHLIPCTGLKHLFLHGCQADINDANPSALLSYESLPLDGIEFDCHTAHGVDLTFRSTSQYPKPIINLGSLKSIKFRINDDPKLGRLEVFQYANHLEALHLKLGLITDSVAIVPCVLPSLNTLTSLTIGFNFQNAKALSPICRELQKLAGRNRITTLAITFIIETSDPPEDEWNLLEKMLLTDGWSSLRRFDLNIRIITWEGVEDQLPHHVYEDTFETVHATHLAGLATTKLFKYNFTITRGPWSLHI